MIDSFRYYTMSDPDRNPRFIRPQLEPADTLDVPPPPPTMRWHAAEMRHGAWVQRVRPVAVMEARGD